jgi:hypothetical protein
MLNIILAIIAVLGFIVAVRGVFYARRAEKQTEIARKANEKLDEQAREVTVWQVKHETIALQLSKVSLNTYHKRPDGSIMDIYHTIFSDAKFREKLERYVVDRDGSVMTPRSPTELELRSPALRETVTKANAILDAFDKQNPGIVGLYMARG